MSKGRYESAWDGYDPEDDEEKDESLIRRGDVIWMTLSQTLTSVHNANPQAEKARPFIVLQDTKLERDHNYICKKNVSLLGITGTSQEILTAGRPHISFQITGHADITTYAHTDTLFTIQCRDKKIKRVHALDKDKLAALEQDLDKVLQPEKRFYFKELAGKKCLPGDIWDIETASHKGQALVLLRRGSFTLRDVFNEEGEQVYQPGPHAKTPYLVMFFDKPLPPGATNLQGLQWTDVSIMPVHEGAFQKKRLEVGPATSGNILNTLRRQIGLQPIIFKQHAINDLSTFFTTPFSFLSFRNGF